MGRECVVRKQDCDIALTVIAAEDLQRFEIGVVARDIWRIFRFHKRLPHD